MDGRQRFFGGHFKEGTCPRHRKYKAVIDIVEGALAADAERFAMSHLGQERTLLIPAISRFSLPRQ